MRFAFSSRRETTMIDKSRETYSSRSLSYIFIRRECDPTEKTLAPLMSCKRSPFDRSIPWHSFPSPSTLSLFLPLVPNTGECIAIPSVFSISFLLTCSRLLPNEIPMWKTARYDGPGTACIISVILCIYFFEVCVLHICMRKHEEIIYRAQIAIHDVRTPSDSFIIPSYRTENSLDALLSLSPAHSKIIFLLISRHDVWLRESGCAYRANLRFVVRPRCNML